MSDTDIIDLVITDLNDLVNCEENKFCLDYISMAERLLQRYKELEDKLNIANTSYKLQKEEKLKNSILKNIDVLNEEKLNLINLITDTLELAKISKENDLEGLIEEGKTRMRQERESPPTFSTYIEPKKKSIFNILKSRLSTLRHRKGGRGRVACTFANARSCSIKTKKIRNKSKNFKNFKKSKKFKKFKKSKKSKKSKKLY